MLKNTGERLYGNIVNCWQTTAEFCLLLQVVVLSVALVLVFSLGQLEGLLVDLKQLLRVRMTFHVHEWGSSLQLRGSEEELYVPDAQGRGYSFWTPWLSSYFSLRSLFSDCYVAQSLLESWDGNPCHRFAVWNKRWLWGGKKNCMCFWAKRLDVFSPFLANVVRASANHVMCPAPTPLGTL